MTVIDINESKLRRGELLFLHCPRCEGGEFGVSVAHGGDKPVVTGLVCTSCEHGYTVVYGKLE